MEEAPEMAVSNPSSRLPTFLARFDSLEFNSLPMSHFHHFGSPFSSFLWFSMPAEGLPLLKGLFKTHRDFTSGFRGGVFFGNILMELFFAMLISLRILMLKLLPLRKLWLVLTRLCKIWKSRSSWFFLPQLFLQFPQKALYLLALYLSPFLSLSLDNSRCIRFFLFLFLFFLNIYISLFGTTSDCFLYDIYGSIPYVFFWHLFLLVFFFLSLPLVIYLFFWTES